MKTNERIVLSKTEASNSIFCFTGEFGYEMISWIPYLLYLKDTLGIRFNTISRRGSKVFYYFSDNHIEVGPEFIGDMWGDQKKYGELQKLYPDRLLVYPGPDLVNKKQIVVEDIEWTNKDIHTIISTENYAVPDYTDVKFNYDFKLKKPFVVVNNKYFRQWYNTYKAPLNYFDPQEFKSMAKTLNEMGYMVVYNHYIEKTSSDQYFQYDFNQIGERDDQIISLNNYYKGLEPEERNRFQLSLYNDSEFVIGPQGGNLYLPALCKKDLWILMRDGRYVDYLEFGKLYGIQVNAFYEPWHMENSIKQVYKNKDYTFFTAKSIEKMHFAIKGYSSNMKDCSSMNPMISICIPTYNRRHFIEEAINSVLSQEYDNYEIVVVDDGSTDETGDLINLINNDKIQYIRKDHTGASDTRNRAISEAKGEFILWLGSDDLLMPNTLNKYASILRNQSDIDVIYGNLIVTDAKLNPIKNEIFQDWSGKNSELLGMLIKYNPIPDGGSIIRKSCYDKIGKYNKEFTRAHDYEWWSRAALKVSFVHLNDFVYKWRWHDNNMSSGTVEINTDFESRVVQNMLEQYSLRELSPDLDWDIVDSNKAKAIVYQRVALRMFRLNDFHNSTKFIQMSLDKFPFQETANLASEIYNGVLTRLYTNQQSNNKELLPQLSLKSILSWTIGRGTVNINNVEHRLIIKCNRCDSESNFIAIHEIKEQPSSSIFICHKCKNISLFSEELFTPYFTSLLKTKNQVLKHNLNPITKSRLAYFIKDAHIITGGAKVVFQHINWLMKLGVDVTVYSFEPQPRWIDYKINFTQIQSFEELYDKKFDQIIVFSIFEIPEIVQRIHPSRIYLFCQGFEGYHYGRNYDDIRTDKYLLNEMHRLPIGSIVISKHLVDLFKEKFNKDSYYIPNGIDHNIFKPSRSLTSREKSIAFIGNPFHFLKGLSFLVSTIKAIQKSNYKIEDLKLTIVMGFNPQNKVSLENNLEQETGIKIEILTELTSAEVATVLQKSSLVVCSSVYEGFSLPILEAMACGTPVITTRNMGAESFCVDGKNSFLVDFGDVDSLGKRIIVIMQNTDSYTSPVIEGIKTSYEFNERNTLKTLVNVFESITNLTFKKQVVEKLLNETGTPKELSEENIKNVLSSSDISNKINAKDLISIIIPTYNKLKYVIEAIASLEKTLEMDYEILIVDDASTEDMIEPFKNNKTVKVLRNEINSGFSKSVNKGIKAATGKYILLVNNDTVCTKSSIDRMVEIAESKKDYGLVGVISNNASGPQWDRKAKYSTLNQMHAYAKKTRLEHKGKFYEFPRIAFLFTLIKREVIEKIGGLDERFSPGYYEDDDFCLRAQLAGFKGVIAEDVFIHHYGSITFKENGTTTQNSVSEINREKFSKKWGGNPDEIWLKGKQLRIRNIHYPINNSIFIEAFSRALLHSEENDFELALTESERAIKNFENSDRTGYENISKTDVINFTANIALQLGSLEKAQNYFQTELELNPNSGRACLGLAETFFVAELFHEAKTMYEWAIKNGENRKEVWDKLAIVNKKLSLDAKDYNLDLSSEESFPSLEEAEELINNSDLDGALEILNKLLRQSPSSTEVLNDLAVVKIMQNQIEDALGFISRVIELDPQNEIALENLKYIETHVTP
ncbi:MAG: glycosyltransferase [Melioribacteraceae bacterium]|nr:glycosyltransferase [Melioribacteraceae bacterium]